MSGILVQGSGVTQLPPVYMGSGFMMPSFGWISTIVDYGKKPSKEAKTYRELFRRWLEQPLDISKPFHAAGLINWDVKSDQIIAGISQQIKKGHKSKGYSVWQP